MHPATQRYVERARQLRVLMERTNAIAARLDWHYAVRSFTLGSRHVLVRLLRKIDEQLKSLAINFGHSEEGLAVLAARTPAGIVFDEDQIAFIREQAAGELTHKKFYGEKQRNDDIIFGSNLEITELLPHLTRLVDRCSEILDEIYPPTTDQPHI